MDSPIHRRPIAGKENRSGEFRMISRGAEPATQVRSDERAHRLRAQTEMARETGLEPATSGVTGRRSNQLSYSPAGRRPISQTCFQVKDRKRRRNTTEDPAPAPARLPIRIDLSPMTTVAFHLASEHGQCQEAAILPSSRGPGLPPFAVHSAPARRPSVDRRNYAAHATRKVRPRFRQSTFDAARLRYQGARPGAPRPSARTRTPTGILQRTVPDRRQDRTAQQRQRYAARGEYGRRPLKRRRCRRES